MAKGSNLLASLASPGPTQRFLSGWPVGLISSLAFPARINHRFLAQKVDLLLLGVRRPGWTCGWA